MVFLEQSASFVNAITVNLGMIADSILVMSFTINIFVVNDNHTVKKRVITDIPDSKLESRQLYNRI